MDFVSTYFENSTISYTVFVLSAVILVGLYFAKYKIAGISLGVTYVFLAGIVAGHFGLNPDKDILSFITNFGLILFVYGLGITVGPTFIPSFKKNGLLLNSIASSVILLGTFIAFLIFKFTSLDINETVGLLAGAVSNSPTLITAEQTVKLLSPETDTSIISSTMAVTYPFAVLVIILIIVLFDKIFKKNFYKGSEDAREELTKIISYELTNSHIFGKSISELNDMLPSPIVVTRLWRKGKIHIPKASTLLEQDDLLLIIAGESLTDKLTSLVGVKAKHWEDKTIDWNKLDDGVSARYVYITNDSLNGRTLKALSLRKKYHVSISFVHRGDLEFLATPDLTLLIGDRILVVGEREHVSNAIKLFGNSTSELKKPRLYDLFIGIFLGLIIGYIPIAIPGLPIPVKIGMIGGPLLVGILIGAYGYKFKIISYSTKSTLMFIQHFGITLFFAGLGIASGKAFFEMLFSIKGVELVLLSFIITVIPITFIGWLLYLWKKVDFATVMGVLCASMTNPVALHYVSANTVGNGASVGYASVAPLVFMLRVLLAQLLLILAS